MKTRVSYASAAFLALAISACSQSNIASAEPPGFPDLNGFSEAPVASYTMGWDRGSKTIGFSTANGVDCNFGAPKTRTEIIRRFLAGARSRAFRMFLCTAGILDHVTSAP